MLDVTSVWTAAGTGRRHERAASAHSRPPALPASGGRSTGAPGGSATTWPASGSPLLLIHSINAAGSAYEVRPIFEHAQAHRRVCAVDLPGFGFSDRSDRAYDRRLYVDAVHDHAGRDRGRDRAGSRSTRSRSRSAREFLARAAVERPERFRTLALVTPTGFSRASGRLHGPPGIDARGPGALPALHLPVVEPGLLRPAHQPAQHPLSSSSGPSARTQIDEGLLDYDYLTTHQPGARHAPYAFVSGRLFSTRHPHVYERLTLPVWMPHAHARRLQGLQRGWVRWPRGRTGGSSPIATGALPHFEQPDEFLADYERFLAEARGDDG